MIRAFHPVRKFPRNGYPESDGKPMAETDIHRDLMFEIIAVLKERYAADPNTYVTGNLLLFYERGNKRRHVSPDCFVAFGVPDGFRPNYLMWEEGKGPDVVFEFTSSSTRADDTRRKLALYRDTLGVKEYFLFDPEMDYLDPPMQGYRLRGGQYLRIREKNGRLPSLQLGLHLERDGNRLRLWDPTTGNWLPSLSEMIDAERQKADAERQKADAERQKNTALEAEVERLRQLLAQRKSGTNGYNGK